jgi:hypothetical protein
MLLKLAMAILMTRAIFNRAQGATSPSGMRAIANRERMSFGLWCDQPLRHVSQCDWLQRACRAEGSWPGRIVCWSVTLLLKKSEAGRISAEPLSSDRAVSRRRRHRHRLEESGKVKLGQAPMSRLSRLASLLRRIHTESIYGLA